MKKKKKVIKKKMKNSTSKVELPKSTYRSYKEAQAWVVNRGIKSSVEFAELYQKKAIPRDIPRNPGLVYKENWNSWAEFFKTGSGAPPATNWKVGLTEEEVKFKRAQRELINDLLGGKKK